MTNESPTGLETTLAVAELDRVAGSIEAVFLDAGERLGQAVGCWRSIAQSFADLAQQYEGDDMRHCVDGLHAALAVAAGLGCQTGGSSATRLGGLAGALKDMSARLNRLTKTVGEVKLVGLNAKVEAAHLDAGSLDFSVFTREIDRLANDAAAELALLEGELRELAGQTDAAYKAQAGFSDGHGAELQSVCRRLDEGLALLASQRQRIAAAASLIGQRSRQAGDHVADLVSALQIGDITRQRTEHVSQALGLLGDLPNLAPTLSADEAAQAAALVVNLQSAQLDNSAHDLSREAAEVTRNMGALADEAEEVGQLGHSSFTGAHGTSFLEGLAAEMARTEALLQGYGTALANTETAMREVSKATESMVAHVEAVHSIEADLKIMGLNASFKCSRLGDRGRTLSVVAQTLRQLANRTVEDAGALMGGLKTAMGIAEDLADGQTASEGIDGALANLRAAAAFMAANGASQEAALAGLEAESSRAQGLLREAADGIGITADFSRALREVAIRLRDTTARTAIDPERADELKCHVLANLTGNYTMASERALHDLFGGDEPAATASAEPATVDVDDLLF
ncbi:MAG TPA: methyl-accepting chemotaxis protein [Magnetospirillum sp.]|jgi:hypothetical protein|nr:methyl-accepting chemotaxis protein [Magnetospirillum sp.]